MKDIKVYLAGGFYADNWQDKVIRSFPNMLTNKISVSFYNPKTKERNEDNEIVRKAFSNPKAYTTWDLKAIDLSDYVFAYIDRTNPAVGVIAEIGYAVGMGKKVVLVTDTEDETSYHKDRYFDFIRNMPNVVSFYDLKDGVVYISEIIELENNK